ncbi:putative F-box protein At1g67390 isoform X2 [Capsella rubella]|uniref:putative F-box protein At1g67390 isoform X2 n=1 Tax=Capsella rubella TaxID=81985 RepID=UPI000CD52418|nr:putative F-box protein At1g67390 isoform X2 [Capsella rubella]
MSLFPLSALTTSQLHHPTNPMTASSSSDARGDQILVDTVEDRISELPDDVLVRILKDMTTEDVVKTSVLSQRWKDVWKKVPYLIFDMQKATIPNNMEPLVVHSDRVADSITEEMENFGNKFLLSRDANYFRRLKCLAVAVNVMNWKEVEMLRDVLVSWNGIMRELDILFKDKEEGETSIDGAQETMWEENLFPNADFRVKVVWMFNFSGSNEKQFELASRFITQGTVMKKMMIMSSSVPAKEKLDIEAAVAKLMKLPKGNKKLHIGCF